MSNSKFIVGQSWTGDLPAGWKALRAKRVFKESNLRSQADDEQLSVTQINGVVRQNDLLEAGQKVVLALSGTDNFKHVDVDDFVISLRSFQGGIEWSKISGCVSPAYTVLRAGRPIDPSYWSYLLKSTAFITALRSVIDEGIRDGKSITYELFGETTTPFPPITQQEAISSYLDRSTTRIAGLVAKKLRFIELLREKRQALITHAVTKGLDSSAQMKESGVEWLGEFPKNWGIVQSRRIFAERNEKAIQGDIQLTASQKYGLIPQSEFMEREGRRVVIVQKGQDILKRVYAGDFVISMRSFQGGLEYSELTGSMSSAYVALTPIKLVVPGYFRWLFKSSTYIQALQSTSDLVRDGQALRFENFAKVPLPVVPEPEQKAIAEYLDRATTRIDALIAKTERSIELLREHRTALITAAVTGKIDLRNAI